MSRSKQEKAQIGVGLSAKIDRRMTKAEFSSFRIWNQVVKQKVWFLRYGEMSATRNIFFPSSTPSYS